MAAAKTLTKRDIDHISKLANLPIGERQAGELVDQLGVTVAYVSTLQQLPTKGITETSQVTGMENVFREDIVDKSRILSQKEALAGKKTYKGYFVVDRVLDFKNQ